MSFRVTCTYIVGLFSVHPFKYFWKWSYDAVGIIHIVPTSHYAKAFQQKIENYIIIQFLLIFFSPPEFHSTIFSLTVYFITSHTTDKVKEGIFSLFFCLHRPISYLALKPNVFKVLLTPVFFFSAREKL